MSMQNSQPIWAAALVAASIFSFSSTACERSCMYSNMPYPIALRRLCAITPVTAISRP